MILVFLFMGLLFLRTKYAHKIEHVDVRDLKELMEPYSGYNPEAYVEYINNIQMMVDSIDNEFVARHFLRLAEKNIDDISFNADFRQDEIYELKNHIVSESNSLILRYLNN